MGFLFGLGMLKKCSTCALNDNIFHAFSPTTGNVDYKAPTYKSVTIETQGF